MGLATKALCIALAFFFISPPRQAGPTTEEENLARVGFLHFTNATKNPRYNWVSKSMPEAIKKSMVRNFNFQHQPRAARLAKQRLKKQGKFLARDAREIARRAECDLLVFGTYYYRRGSLSIKTEIYDQRSQAVVATIQEKSRVNNRIFDKVDIIAEKVIAEFYQLARGQQAGSDHQERALKSKKKNTPLWQPVRINLLQSTDFSKKEPNPLWGSSLRLLPGAMLPVASSLTFFEYGVGARIDYQVPWLFQWFHPYLAADVSYLRGTLESNNTWLGALQLGGLVDLFALRTVRLQILVAGGPQVGQVAANSLFVLPTVEAGFNFDWLLTRHLTLTTLVTGAYSFDLKARPFFAKAYLGLGYHI